MKKLLKTVLTAYVVMKVAPPIIKVVTYITKGAAQGVKNKINKDISSWVKSGLKEKEKEQPLGQEYKHNYETYSEWKSRNKEKA